MKLYTAKLAPNPRRVNMFVAEKGITAIEVVMVDMAKQEHKTSPVKNAGPRPFLPVLELDDGRQLAESRAICTYLEGLYPEPNLIGRDAEERAFIEMADRQVDFYFMHGGMHAIRHTHPGFVTVEQPQFPDFGRSQGEKLREIAAWFDAKLANQAYVAGERFTIADITLFCTLEFTRGLLKFNPGSEGFANLQAYRDRIAQRPSATP